MMMAEEEIEGSSTRKQLAISVATFGVGARQVEKL